MSTRSCLIFGLLALLTQGALGQNFSTPRPTPTPGGAPTTPAVGPTSAPEPATPTMAPPRVPDWTVKGPTGTSCILLAGNISFYVNYMTADGYSAYGDIPVPKTATATGDCTGFTNKLVLTWPSTTAAAMPNSVTFMFIKKPVYAAGNDTGMGTYSLATVFGMVNADFPDASPGQSYYVSSKPAGIMSGDLNSSYKCESYQSVPADKTGKAVMTFADIQLEAFKTTTTNTTSGAFGTEMLCSADTVAAVLPIVGYVLAGIVVSSIAAALGYMAYKRAGYTQV